MAGCDRPRDTTDDERTRAGRVDERREGGDTTEAIVLPLSNSCSCSDVAVMTSRDCCHKQQWRCNSYRSLTQVETELVSAQRWQNYYDADASCAGDCAIRYAMSVRGGEQEKRQQ